MDMDTQSRSPSPLPSALERGNGPSSHRPESGDGSYEPSNHHIRLEDAPRRPTLYPKKSLRGTSSKSVSEALRLARSREEQETLLGVEEEADDDGCYPPRVDDAPQRPNAWAHLPVYTNIIRIRRLVIASIGMEIDICPSSYNAALFLFDEPTPLACNSRG